MIFQTLWLTVRWEIIFAPPVSNGTRMQLKFPGKLCVCKSELIKGKLIRFFIFREIMQFPPGKYSIIINIKLPGNLQVSESSFIKFKVLF
jgi:hypothetical protein